MRIFLTLLVCLITSYAYSDVEQNNVSGGNTSIQGGYSASTTYQSGSSSTSNTTNNSTSNIRSAPNSAFAPNVTNSGNDVCSVGASAGVQTFGLGISGGKGFRDLNCERIKLARELKANGMAVASVSILCQDERVFAAMENAGTPCPYKGKIGEEAKKEWKKYGKLRPDYDLYTKELKIIEDTKKKEEIKFLKEMDQVDKDLKKEKKKK
ncbi:MAG: hypothetical protein VW810_00195 [Pelagibacteraceae bacterium]